MIINSTPYYQTSTLKIHRQRTNLNVSDKFSFTGSVGMLNSKTVESLQNVSRAYDDILSHLLKKSDKGLENIEKNYENFSFKKGMVFHNCGEDGVSIAVRKPEGKDFSGLMRVLVRKGNTFFKERIVLDSFMIKNCDRLVKDFDKTHLNYFTVDEKFLTSDEIVNSHANEKLQKITEDLDFAMLQFRRYLMKNKDVDLKIPDFEMSYDSQAKFKNLLSLHTKVSEKLSAIPRKTALLAKNSFADYELTTGQSVHTLKNIGNDKLKMTVTSLNNLQHGELNRLMVFNSDGTIKTGYLVTPSGKIISNFNPQYLAIIPPKLIPYNEKEAEKIIPELDNYISMFTDKFKDFINHIDGIKFSVPKEPKPENIKKQKPPKEPKPPKLPFFTSGLNWDSLYKSAVKSSASQFTFSAVSRISLTNSSLTSGTTLDTIPFMLKKFAVLG